MSVRGPADARALMLVEGDPGGAADPPRPEILASWRRSRRHGVDPASHAHTLGSLTGDTRLTRAAQTAVDAVAPDLRASAAVMVLADRSGRVLHRTATTEGFARTLDEAGLVLGRDLSEEAVGTNAIGTALTTGSLVAVVGSENYHEAFQTLAGVAATVHDPVSGEVLGAVAMVTPAGSSRAAHVALVRQTALLAEQRMLGLDTEAHQRVLARYLAATRSPGDPVFAVSEQTLHAGPDTMRLLAGLSHQDLWAPAHDALTLRPTAELPLMLPSGERVAVRLEAVEIDGALVGAVGKVLDGAPLMPPQVGGRVMSVPEFRAWSPAARRTATALRQAAEQRRAVCVVGEDGVGKATTVRLVAARAFPGRNLVQLDPEDATPARVRTELTRGLPVLVTDAHTLSTRQLLALADSTRAGQERADGWLALTFQGQPHALDEHLVASRLAILPASPLRDRPQDIELVLPSMLRRYAAGRDLRLSPALVDRLRRQPWPTNFHGLEAVVAEMARNATSRVLDVGDLPDAFGAILRRRLTPMEWMTRSAIVSALQANNGSKELAAEALGMSRASIYRKIKAFGINPDDLSAG